LPACLQVTAEHNEDCKKLLRLMGVPVIDAPSEAEAQCAAMAKAGIVYGAATEDMDCLTFGCPRLIRHLMASQVCVGGVLVVPVVAAARRVQLRSLWQQHALPGCMQGG
jgi:hypothetical protein